MRAIICLSGEIASGKTTVARSLAERLPQAIVRSFGDVVRQKAVNQGKKLDRATLQAVGMSLIADGWESFVDELLKDVPSSSAILVIEGIRHREAAEEIARRNLCDRFLTVYLMVDPQVQQARLAERGETLVSRAHAVESSLAEVKAVANLIIDSRLPVVEIVDKIIVYLT
jgi:dephospho-CoA kinase